MFLIRLLHLCALCCLMVFWDFPDPNVVAVTQARQHGFTAQRPLTRMCLGENTAPGRPQLQFAIAGPEFG